MKLKLLFCVPWILAGCASGGEIASVPQPGSVEHRLHSEVMERYAAYKTFNEPKVLSACISDVASRSPRFRVHRVFAWSTAQTSDGLIFAGKLRSNAIQTCLGWSAAENIDCDCLMMDSNGKNVLALPGGGTTVKPQSPKATPKLEQGPKKTQTKI